MIRKIQEDTRGAVAAMQEGTKQVDEGIQLSDKAGKSLREIVGISQRLTEKVTEIASASEQQSRASQQISRNVEAISAVTGETASGTQQIARSVGGLLTMAGKLRQLLKTFSLDGGAGAGDLSGGAEGFREVETQTPRLAVRANGKIVSHEKRSAQLNA